MIEPEPSGLGGRDDRYPAPREETWMEDSLVPYRVEISFDKLTWREMPRGYRQDGTVLENDGGVVTQSIGRGGVVYYRAVGAEAVSDRG